MDGRVPLAVLVGVLVALSGCSALIADDGTPAAEPDVTVTPSSTPTATPPGTPAPDDGGTERSPTADRASPTPDPTPTPTATESPGRTFDASALEDAHVSALRDAGSFRTSSALVIRNGTATRYINGTYAVETDGPAFNAANITYRTDDGTTDYPTTHRYTEGDTTYERRFEENGTVYRKGVEPYNDSDPRPVDRAVAYSFGRIAYAVIDASTWTATGSGTIEGASVSRYEATGDAFDADGFPGASGNATVVVDERGIVRYVAYRFGATIDGERTEYVYEGGYTDVGNTSVEKPAWTENA